VIFYQRCRSLRTRTAPLTGPGCESE
jgi:hypothetical protein